MPAAMKQSDRELIIAEIMKNVSTAAELHAKTAGAEEKRKKTEEVEAEAQRWVAVGQSAATKLLAVLREKGVAGDALRDEGALLDKMGIPHDRLQWAAAEQEFY